MMIEAIPTIYQGVHYRSRLEARWAATWAALDVRCAYEPRAFDFVERAYVPDFYLEELGLWIEIKPARPSEEERRKAELLAREVRGRVLILAGHPYPGAFDVVGYFYRPSQVTVSDHAALGRVRFKKDYVVLVDFNGRASFAQCLRCGRLQIVRLREDERITYQTTTFRPTSTVLFLDGKACASCGVHSAHDMSRVLRATRSVRAIQFNDEVSRI